MHMVWSHLQHDAKKRPAPQHVQRHTNHHLMPYGTYKEDQDQCPPPAPATHRKGHTEVPRCVLASHVSLANAHAGILHVIAAPDAPPKPYAPAHSASHAAHHLPHTHTPVDAVVECWEVDCTKQPLVHRHVPQLPVVTNSGSVPPILVELTVTKTRQLRRQQQQRQQTQQHGNTKCTVTHNCVLAAV
jgi:hypothetical protein